MVIGSDRLSERYRRALATLGHDSQAGPPDAAALGLAAIARAAGLLS